MSPLKIIHFSDILCVWAYIGDTNLGKLAENFEDRIDVETRFCSVFPDSHGKISAGWSDRGGFNGYSEHVQQVADRFPEITLHSKVWSTTRPKSSASPHLFIKALELLDSGEPDAHFQKRIAFKAAAALRKAFFVEARDISDWSVQREISMDLGFDFDDVRNKIETGEAIAKLAADYEVSQSFHVRGSPTYILNEGRQALFGNISYGILAANVAELLSEQQELSGSMC